jgi:hypothetical protein
VRLIADENCDFSLVTDLRAAGYDVVSINEQTAGADDQKVIDVARSERRLLRFAWERFENQVSNRTRVRHNIWQTRQR